MLSLPHRTTFLLAPKKSDGSIARDLREKSHSLSLKPQKKPKLCKPSRLLHISSLLLKKEDGHYLDFCPIIIKHFNNANHVPKHGFLTFSTISAVRFHHFSTHATCVTRVHVIGDFCHITCRFMAPDTRYLEKRANYVSEFNQIRRVS